MTLKQLSYFLEVYRCRNIQAAADKLYISHQGLSRAIRELEDELGAALFTRSNRGLAPTDFAKALVPHVQCLLDDYATIQGVHTLTSREKAVVSVCALDHLVRLPRRGASSAISQCVSSDHIEHFGYDR